ncbi:MAG TPA: pyridoxamine 5'-phosphate oxidase family protein [Ktedonobacterales bacterium]|jgi:PPOX class probable F420-dependent enzyme
MLDLTHKRDAHIDQRLREDLIIWLGSVRPDGRPHLVAVWFLWTGQSLLIFSQPHQQKIRNLRQNQHVILALDNTNLGVDPITLEGEAELLADPEVNTTLPDYVAKYGARITGIGYTPETMAKAYSQTIRITSIRFHDPPTG